jgi:flagellar basal-body rod protein FlgF
MDNALYVSLSRQMTLRRELDVIANNVANADTTGFKVEGLLTREEDGEPAQTLQAPGWARFVLDDGVARNFSQGALHQTGNPLDLGIDGQGFFRVQTAGGDRYTRDGRFTLSAGGQLTTAGGDPVLDQSGSPITLDPTRGAVAVSETGSITQGANQVGAIGVFRFDDLSQLEKDGNNQFRNVANLQPTAAPDARVRQGMLESSNVNPIFEITRMIEVQRAYDSVAHMMDSTADLSAQSIQRLGRVS